MAEPNEATSSSVAATAKNFSVRAMEAVLRDVLDHVPSADSVASLLAGRAEPLIAFTQDRTILCANAAGEQLFGYPPGGLVGRVTDDLVPERLRQPSAPPMTTTADLVSVDLPAVRRDGTELPMAWTFGSARMGDSWVFVLLARPRLEMDDALEALSVSEERFRLLVDGVRDHAIFMLDAHGHVTTWNKGAERILGWAKTDIEGKHYGAFFSQAERDDGVPGALLARALAEGGHTVRGWRVRADGTRFLAEAFVSPLFSREGELRGFAKLVHDLTERLQAEENERRLALERAAREAAEAAEARARLSEERLRRIQALTMSMSKAVTPAELARAVLEQFESVVGAQGAALYQSSLDGRHLHLLHQFGHGPSLGESFTDMPVALRSPLTDAARTGVARFYESRAEWLSHYPELSSAKSAGWFEASALLPLVAGGETLGALGVRFHAVRSFDEPERALLRTIAELCAQSLQRARLFASEQDARERAEAASRSKDEFLAMLGHELRNPLAPISTALHLMKLRGDESTARERQVLERQVRHMTKLVDDLLDVSRITRGLVELQPRNLEIFEVVTRAVEMSAPILEQQRHRFSMKCPPEGLRVLVDPERLAQIVSNLLTNAAKYTPPGGDVELSVVREGSEVVVAVRDTGHGISAELLPRVFDLFVQGQRTIERSQGGLGLGLALVKSLTAMQGGRVSAASAGPGRGSTFEVRLPAVDEPAAAAPEEPSPSIARAQLRVLVVDDNQDAAELLAIALRDAGHQVETAYDGVAALERLREFPADAAVLDLGLPVLDGYELAQRIRSDYPSKRPRLIALTGYGQAHDRERSREYGFDTHLVKPVDFAKVIAALEGA